MYTMTVYNIAQHKPVAKSQLRNGEVPADIFSRNWRGKSDFCKKPVLCGPLLHFQLQDSLFPATFTPLGNQHTVAQTSP